MSYISDAAEFFLSLTPETPFLSPLDYCLLAEWEKQEIPLFVVLKAIEACRAGRAPAKDLVDLKSTVKEIYVEWLSTETGSRQTVQL